MAPDSETHRRYTIYDYYYFYRIVIHYAMLRDANNDERCPVRTKISLLLLFIRRYRYLANVITQVAHHQYRPASVLYTCNNINSNIHIHVFFRTVFFFSLFPSPPPHQNCTHARSPKKIHQHPAGAYNNNTLHYYALPWIE